MIWAFGDGSAFERTFWIGILRHLRLLFDINREYESVACVGLDKCFLHADAPVRLRGSSSSISGSFRVLKNLLDLGFPPPVFSVSDEDAAGVALLPSQSAPVASLRVGPRHQAPPHVMPH
jgi:hypothetical protein